MAMIQEFKDFINKGNVMDLAVGVIMGGAFGKIVESLVADVLTPVLGIVTGGVDFKAYKIALKGDAAIGIGSFINAVITFIFVAFAVFMLVKGYNKMRKPAEAAPAAPAGPTDVELLAEIRDLLKK